MLLPSRDSNKERLTKFWVIVAPVISLSQTTVPATGISRTFEVEPFPGLVISTWGNPEGRGVGVGAGVGVGVSSGVGVGVNSGVGDGDSGGMYIGT